MLVYKTLLTLTLGVYRLLEDDGMFLMQVAGLRQGANWQDLAWGLFMSRYIFPGADASTPCIGIFANLRLPGLKFIVLKLLVAIIAYTSWVVRQLMSNRKTMLPKYGPYLYRLWEIFLGWSVVAAGQGSATCYQIVVNKNKYDFLETDGAK